MQNRANQTDQPIHSVTQFDALFVVLIYSERTRLYERSKYLRAFDRFSPGCVLCMERLMNCIHLMTQSESEALQANI